MCSGCNAKALTAATMRTKASVRTLIYLKQRSLWPLPIPSQILLIQISRTSFTIARVSPSPKVSAVRVTILRARIRNALTEGKYTQHASTNQAPNSRSKSRSACSWAAINNCKSCSAFSASALCFHFS